MITEEQNMVKESIQGRGYKRIRFESWRDIYDIMKNNFWHSEIGKLENHICGAKDWLGNFCQSTDVTFRANKL